MSAVRGHGRFASVSFVIRRENSKIGIVVRLANRVYAGLKGREHRFRNGESSKNPESTCR